jgi:hypothetical protein
MRLNPFVLPATVQIDFADGTSCRSRPRKPLGGAAGRVGGNCPQATEASLHTMLQVLSVTLFERVPSFPLFSDIEDNKKVPDETNLLKLL